MAKSKQKQVYIDILTNALKEASMYETRFDIEIGLTASAMAELEEMEAIVRKEKHTYMEMGSQGQEKRVSHPLLPVINNFHRTITQQLTSLGLNRLKMQPSADDQKDDTLTKFISAMS